ncbi:MAG: hypothetical protein ACRENP_12875 [Longimicrobiales bacterium]
MKRLLLGALSISLVACSSDTSGPSNAELAGSWRFSYVNMTGGVQGAVLTCNVASLDFTITQTGTTFSGVQNGAGRMSCVSGGQTIVDQLIGGETIVGGQITGQSITFRLGTIAGPHSATVAGTSISGTAQWVFPAGTTTVTMNGQFTAARM